MNLSSKLLEAFKVYSLITIIAMTFSLIVAKLFSTSVTYSWIGAFFPVLYMLLLMVIGFFFGLLLSLYDIIKLKLLEKKNGMGR